MVKIPELGIKMLALWLSYFQLWTDLWFSGFPACEVVLLLWTLGAAFQPSKLMPVQKVLWTLLRMRDYVAQLFLKSYFDCLSQIQLLYNYSNIFNQRTKGGILYTCFGLLSEFRDLYWFWKIVPPSSFQWQDSNFDGNSKLCEQKSASVVSKKIDAVMLA